MVTDIREQGDGCFHLWGTTAEGHRPVTSHILVNSKVSSRSSEASSRGMPVRPASHAPTDHHVIIVNRTFPAFIRATMKNEARVHPD